MLNEQLCRTVTCPDGARGKKFWDRDGLYLYVSSAQGKHWRYNYQCGGQQRTLCIGSYSKGMSLREAREKVRDINSDRAKNPTYDPVLERRHEKAQARAERQRLAEEAASRIRFRDAAESYFMFRVREKKWSPMDAELRRLWVAGEQLPRGTRHPQNTEHRARDRAKRHLFPVLGDCPMNELTPQLLAQVINQIGAGNEREKTQQLLSGIVGYWHDQQPDGTPNPMAKMKFHLTVSPHVSGNHSAIIEPRKFGMMVRDIQAVEQYNLSRPILAFFMCQVYLWQRTGALSRMRWENVDFDAAVWNCPLADMKNSQEKKEAAQKKLKSGNLDEGFFRVPLPRQVIKILQDLKFSSTCEYVFTYRGGPFSDGAALALIKRAGYSGKQTMHGFRACATSIMRNKFIVCDRDAVEVHLGHKVEKYDNAYFRAVLDEMRAYLIQEWADLVDHLVEIKPIEDFYPQRHWILRRLDGRTSPDGCSAE